jgi:CRISPR system Cascade subunit CasD
MSTLLLRLAAPLQSWGAASKFDTRDTAREPTKSGVIGLLAAALGRGREQGTGDLNALRFGVRIDQPGFLLRDYHTASLNLQNPPFVTIRYYLADAVFLVGLEGVEGFLSKLVEALNNPFYPLYLGRRSCPPVGRLVIGLRHQNLLQALEEEPWQANEWFQKKKGTGPVKLTVVYDAGPGEKGAFMRRDLPITFDQNHRQYAFRMVRDDFERVETSSPADAGIGCPTEHDAMAGWEG